MDDRTPYGLAGDLSRALEAALGYAVPVVQAEADGPCLLQLRERWSDGYDNWGTTETLSLRGVHRRDGSAVALDVRWQVHENAGHTDEWIVQGVGLDGESFDPVRSTLAPRGGPYFGNHARISVVVDGTAR